MLSGVYFIGQDKCCLLYTSPDTWDVAGFIQKRFIEEERDKKGVLKQPFDTLKAYNSILKMFEYYTKGDDLAQVPNEKGKIKNKYRKANASTILVERPNLINGGIQFFNLDKNKEALQFFATYVESASYPMLAEQNLAKTDTLLAQIAYYATLAADRVGDKDAIIKYLSLIHIFYGDSGFEPSVQFPFLCLLQGPNVLLLPLLSYLYRNCQVQACH